ncbi:right-handed parallel beta-helix repeat-containing protein [Halomicrobium sp. IBSBa]|uniref:NosD domain-containing protein n=1 Tax=Halomicrobium sp. IBSBa TaxID=2778916 RepID=UPI001ABF253B|nr:NosD domain-containing protein [Halomicrobium sp. IBSBa]MBO4247342.1 right-handed parallel beta-helix repeat-containing protein [Halomicrobium sp. IBSBa]
MGSSETTGWQWLAITLVAVAAVVVTAAFTADAGSARPEPVAYDETVGVGLTMEAEQIARAEGASVPRAEVFYSQFRYVVGYSGVDRLVSALDAPARASQFGYPLAVYVSDYGGVSVDCSAGGSLSASATPAWTPAETAHYVVDSDARSPAGPVIVPFEDRADAEAFTDDCGGRVVDWGTVRAREPPTDDPAGAVRAQVEQRASRADERVGAAREHRDRPVSVVVGRDVATVRAAIDRAPPNTTIRVPTATTVGNVTVDKPVTLRGEGTRLDGGGDGTVLRVTADRVGVVGFEIVGVGNATVGESTDDDSSWDAPVRQGYGQSDAALAARNVSGLFVANVSVETPASGFVLVGTPGAVVENVTVDGTDDWRDGFMGVVGMDEPIVVQHSTFTDGRDGVYLHRADGTVLRNNTFRRNRFGTHLMYTSDTLVADNRARDQRHAGIVVMTDPSGNAIVGNDVRRARSGILTAGSGSYVGHNVVVGTERGLSTNAGRSLYEHNVLADNGVGVIAATIVPSNRVVENDFVANDRHATSRPGPMRIYTHDGRGNYWSGAYDLDGGGRTLSRPYSPTDAVDRRLHRRDAAVVLGEAPSVHALRSLRGTTPGFRSASIVDTAPLTEPANPRLLATATNETTDGGVSP